MKKILLFVCVMVHLGWCFSDAQTVKEGDPNMSEEMMCTIDVMAYDYEVKVLINNIDIGLKGGKSESKRLFGKNHPMVKQLDEKSRCLVCLKEGENEIQIEYRQLTDEFPGPMTIEMRAEEQFMTTTDEYLFFLRTDEENISPVMDVFYLK
jgi:hypothetical protein